MRTLEVALGARAYPVLVGRGLLLRLGELERLTQVLAGRQVFLASDDAVWSLHGDRLERGLRAAGARIVGRAVMPAGEAHKGLESAGRFWDGLVTAGVERGGCLVALGGGVVGDVAGFAAATYLRGIDFVQVPTTLLAMVDSSVGGKTGVDHPRGKNLIGAFHQPRAVVADLEVLATLPAREVRSGFAEVIKAALLGDAELFGLLERRGPALAEDPEALEEAVARAVALKVGVVTADEREAGSRALLNLGHTLGHAVEAAAGFGAWTHGDAVALGLGFAARLSSRVGLLAEADRCRALELLAAWGYPSRAPGLPTSAILAGLRHDKKNVGGRPRWVLLRGIGRAEWGVPVDPEAIESLLVEMQEGR